MVGSSFTVLHFCSQTIKMLSTAVNSHVFYVTAKGASARSFLIKHFQILNDFQFHPFLVCSNDIEAAQVVEKTGVEHLPVALSDSISPVADLRALFQLLRYIRRLKPQFVHGHMSKAGFASLLAARILNVPVRVYHNHGMACFSATGLKRLLLELIEKATCRFATDIIFCSESTREQAISLGLCKADKSQVLGEGTISGVDLDQFSPRQAAIQADVLATDLNLPPDRQYVLFVGRIVAHKGIDTLIQAWRLITEKTRHKTTLLIAGANAGDALYSRLDALVQSDSSVRYLGRIDNVVGLYGLADLLVLPSWHEGFPYSVLEAQACGLPAIVSRVTGNVDSVLDGETGLHVEKSNAEDLAAAIEQLLSDPGTLNRLGLRATERVEEHFQQDLVLSNLVEFYRSRASG